MAREANLIDGFKSAPNAPMVTQLQFVDTLIFCVTREEQVKNVNRHPIRFSKGSDSKITGFGTQIKFYLTIGT